MLTTRTDDVTNGGINRCIGGQRLRSALAFFPRIYFPSAFFKGIIIRGTGAEGYFALHLLCIYKRTGGWRVGLAWGWSSWDGRRLNLTCARREP